MAVKKKLKTPEVYKVDFRKEEGGGKQSVRVKPGDYKAKIASIEIGKTGPNSKNPDTPMIIMWFALEENVATSKKASGQVRDNIVIQNNQLWKLRRVMEALGMQVPKKVVGVPLKKMVGKTLVVTLDDGEPYKGKIKSEVADVLDPDAVSDPEFDTNEDDDDEDDDEDLDELDRAELKALIKEESLDVKVKKTMDEDEIREAIKEARGEDDDDDDEDEDDDDDLEELDVDDDL